MRINLGKKIGSGTFANVYESVIDDTPVACKIISSYERDARLEYELHCAFYHEDGKRVVKPIAYCPLFDGENNMIILERFDKSLYTSMERGETKGDKIKEVVDTAIDNLRFFNEKEMYHRDCHLNNITSDGRLFDFGMASVKDMKSPTNFYEDNTYDKHADVNMLMWSLYKHFPRLRTNTLSKVREYVEDRLIVAIKSIDSNKLVCGTEVMLKDGTLADYVYSTKTMHYVQLRNGKRVRRKRVGVVLNRHVMHYMSPHKFPGWHGSLKKSAEVTTPVKKKRQRTDDDEIEPLTKKQNLSP